MTSQGYRAVILAAGNGSRVPELVANNFPKCLLPIGGRPMIFYSIKMLEKYFQSIEIIVKSTQRQKIEEVLKQFEFKTSFEFVEIVPELDLGTTVSLSLLPDRFSHFSNLLVVSCDFISNFEIDKALKQFEVNDSTLLTVWFNSNTNQLLKNLQVPGLTKSGFKQESTLLVVDTLVNQMVLMKCASGIESNQIKLPESINAFGEFVSVFSKLTESHIYIMKKWVFQHLKYICEDVENVTMTSLQSEFIPNLIEIQFMTKRDRDFHILNMDPKFIKTKEFLKDNNTAVKCHAYIDMSSTFAFRVNNLPIYWYLNTSFKKYFPAKIDSNRADRKIVNKNSIIGNQCDISNGTRLVNCLLMDNVKICGEKCILENCLIGENVVINADSVLKNCLVSHDYVIESNSQLTNEILLSEIDNFLDLSNDNDDTETSDVDNDNDTV